MKINDVFTTAWSALMANTSRSALTVLGIVIGITAIMVVMSVGAGARALILTEIEGIGGRTISIEPGREPKGPMDFAELFTDSLTKRDVEALRRPRNVQGVARVTPEVLAPASVSHADETMRVTVIGSTDFFGEVFKAMPREGNFFSEDDIKQKAKVALIGSEVARELFGESSPLREKIKIKNQNFEVAGVFEERGQSLFVNIDELVLVPYTTAQTYLLGIDYFHAIIVQAQTEAAVPRVVRAIKETLRENHGITDPDKDDFHVHTQADAISTVGTITSVLTALLGAVAAISLLVGGVGIMNIMLVSVTERTREIGLRKALGATERHILLQFLTEAVLLTLMGGIIGIAAGGGIAYAASLALSKTVAAGWVYTFPLGAGVLGVAVSAGVGLVFGLNPALRAARKSPIEALRYE